MGEHVCLSHCDHMDTVNAPPTAPDESAGTPQEESNAIATTIALAAVGVVVAVLLVVTGIVSWPVLAALGLFGALAASDPATVP